MIGPNPHHQIDEENRERDRRLAELIRRNPGTIELARANLQRWVAHWGGSTPAWKEWEHVLNMLTPNQIADFLESRTPMAERLRQSSPFLGVLQTVTDASTDKSHAA